MRFNVLSLPLLAQIEYHTHICLSRDMHLHAVLISLSHYTLSLIVIVSTIAITTTLAITCTDTDTNTESDVGTRGQVANGICAQAGGFSHMRPRAIHHKQSQ